MNRLHIYEAFKQFGTIKQVEFAGEMPTYNWVRIYYVGEAHPVEAQAMQKIAVPEEQQLKVFKVYIIMRNRPLIKRLPLSVPGILGQPNGSTSFLDRLDDAMIEKVCEHLPVMDLCSVAQMNPRLRAIVYKTMRRRYSDKVFEYEDLKSNGFVTYEEMVRLVHSLGHSIPARYNLPMDYSAFMEEVMIDLSHPQRMLEHMHG